MTLASYLAIWIVGTTILFLLMQTSIESLTAVAIILCAIFNLGMLLNGLMNGNYEVKVKIAYPIEVVRTQSEIIAKYNNELITSTELRFYTVPNDSICIKHIVGKSRFGLTVDNAKTIIKCNE